MRWKRENQKVGKKKGVLTLSSNDCSFERELPGHSRLADPSPPHSPLVHTQAACMKIAIILIKVHSFHRSLQCEVIRCPEESFN